MVIAFGMSSTMALETSHKRKNSESGEQFKRERFRSGVSGSSPHPWRPLEAPLAKNDAQLTSVEVFLVLGLVVTGIPMVVFAVLAHLNHEDILVVPLVALHS